MNPILTRPEIEGAKGETPANGNHHPPEREWSVFRVVHLLWKRRRALVKASVICLLLATAAAFLIPPRYQAVVQLMPPDNNSGSGMIMAAANSKLSNGLGMMAGPLLEGFLSGSKSSHLMVGVLESRTVADRLIERFGLRSVYRESRWQDARDKLAERTVISEDRKTGIIRIQVTDQDPRRAAAMATAYADELNQLVSTLNTSAAHREREFLESRLKEVHTDLQEAEVRFSEFASKNATLDLKEEGRSVVDASARVQGQLLAAEAQLEGLRQIFGEENAQVRGARARIAVLKKQLQAMEGTGTNSQQTDTLFPSLRKLPTLGVEYSDLYRRTKIEETVFEILTQSYELAKVEEAKEIPTVKVLDQPVVPEKKSFPPRMLLMLLGATAGFLLAGAWVVVEAVWHDSDTEHPTRKLLGVIGNDIGNGRVFRYSRKFFSRGNGHRPDDTKAI